MYVVDYDKEILLKYNTLSGYKSTLYVYFQDTNMISHRYKIIFEQTWLHFCICMGVHTIHKSHR